MTFEAEKDDTEDDTDNSNDNSHEIEEDDEDRDHVENNLVQDDSDDFDEDGPTRFEELERPLQKEDYVLIQFAGKKMIYYCGVVIKDREENGDYEVRYLKKYTKIKGSFVQPDPPQILPVAESDIVMILPTPILHGTTKRQKEHLKFEVNFGQLDVR